MKICASVYSVHQPSRLCVFAMCVAAAPANQPAKSAHSTWDSWREKETEEGLQTANGIKYILHVAAIRLRCITVAPRLLLTSTERAQCTLYILYDSDAFSYRLFKKMPTISCCSYCLLPSSTLSQSFAIVTCTNRPTESASNLHESKCHSFLTHSG